MKKNLVFGLLLSMVMVSCASKKSVAPAPEAKVGGRQEIEVPCKQYGFDDKEYFRGVGTATNINEMNARLAALNAAKEMVRQKIGGFVSGLTTSYSRTVAGEAQSDKVQRIMEGELSQLVERMLNDAIQTCEKEYLTDLGQYQSYIAIEISKEELVDKSIDRLSKNEELEIEFNRDQFRKYAEEKMAKMKEAENARK